MDILRKKYKQGEVHQKTYREKATDALVRNDDHTRLNSFLKSSSESDFEVKFNMQKSKTYENFCNSDLFNDDKTNIKGNAAENISESNNDEYLIKQMLRLRIKDEDPSIDELKINEKENDENKNLDVRNIERKMKTDRNNFKQKKSSKMNGDAMVRKDDYTRLNDFLKSSSESDFEEKFDVQKIEACDNFHSLDLHNGDATDIKVNAAENRSASNNDLDTQSLRLSIKDEDSSIDEKRSEINEKDIHKNSNINLLNIKAKMITDRNNIKLKKLSQMNGDTMLRNDDYTTPNEFLTSSESHFKKMFNLQRIETQEKFYSSDLFNDDETGVKENAAENINASDNNECVVKQRLDLEIKDEDSMINEKRLEINEKENDINSNINVLSIESKMKTDRDNIKQKKSSQMNGDTVLRNGDYTKLNDILKSSSESDFEEKCKLQKIETREKFCYSDLFNDDGTDVKENASENINASKNDKYLVTERFDLDIKNENANVNEKRPEINEKEHVLNSNISVFSIKSDMKTECENIKQKKSPQINRAAMVRNDDYTKLNDCLKNSSESDCEEKFYLQKIETCETFCSSDLLSDDETYVKENAVENINASNNNEYVIKQRFDLEIKDEDPNINGKGLEINEKENDKNSNINVLNIKSQTKTDRNKIKQKKSSLKQSNPPLSVFSISCHTSSQCSDKINRQKRKKMHYSESYDHLESFQAHHTKYMNEKSDRRNLNQRKVIKNNKLNQYIPQRLEISSSCSSIVVKPKLDASDQNPQYDIRKLRLNCKTLDKQKDKHSCKTDNEQFLSDLSFEQTPRKPDSRSSIMGNVSQSRSISLVQTDDHSYELEPGEIPLFRKDYEKLLDQCEQRYSLTSLSVFNDNTEDSEEGETDPNIHSSVNGSCPRRFGKIHSWWKRQKQAFANTFKACFFISQ